MLSVIKETWYAFKKPWKAPSFILYFIVMVIGFGGIGVFLSIYQLHYYRKIVKEQLESTIDIIRSAIAQNMMTYAIAIIVPAALVIFLHIIIPKAKHKISHSIITIAVLLCVILIVCFTYIKGSFVVASISVFLSWVFWVIANSENETLQDESYNTMIQKEVKKHGNNWH